MTTVPSRRNRWLVGLALALLLVALPVLGLVLGFQIGRAAGDGSFARWQRLPDPPTPAVEIVAGGTELSNSSWFVYVRGANGEIYYCPPDTPGDCWVPAAEPLDPPEVEVCDQPGRFDVAPPPGRVLDTLQTDACNVEAVYQVNFAVLDDGSVWRWQHFTSGLFALAEWGFASLCGALLGLVLAVVVTVVVLLRRRQTRPGRSAPPGSPA